MSGVATAIVPVSALAIGLASPFVRVIDWVRSWFRIVRVEVGVRIRVRVMPRQKGS